MQTSPRKYFRENTVPTMGWASELPCYYSKPVALEAEAFQEEYC